MIEGAHARAPTDCGGGRNASTKSRNVCDGHLITNDRVGSDSEERKRISEYSLGGALMYLIGLRSARRVDE